MTKEELKRKVMAIRDEKNEKANTGARVGGAMLDMINESVEPVDTQMGSSMTNVPIKQLQKAGERFATATNSNAVEMVGFGTALTDVITEINVSKLYPTGGVGGTNKYTLAGAIAKIPAKYRTVGIKCSFVDDGGDVQIWTYNGGGYFSDASNWVNIDSISQLSHFSLIQMPKGIFYNFGNGEIQQGSQATSTYMFTVKSSTRYKVGVDNGNADVYVCFYDNLKKRISSIKISDTFIFETPQNCLYATITIWSGNAWDYMFVVDITYMDYGLFYLVFENDTNTTRCKVPFEYRRQGLIITYKGNNGRWITEQYASDFSHLNDAAWGPDTHWNQLSSNSTGSGGVEIDMSQVLTGLIKKGEFNLSATTQYLYKNSVDVKIKAGSKVLVTGKVDPSVFSGLWALGAEYADGKKEIIGGNHIAGTTYEIIPAKDVVKLYIPYNMTTKSAGKVSYTIEYSDSVNRKIGEIEKKMVDLNEKSAEASKSYTAESAVSLIKWDGSCFNPGNGVIETGRHDRFSTRMIAVAAGAVYRLLTIPSSGVYYALFFTKDKAFIKFLNIKDDYLGYNVFSIPNNAAYLAFTFSSDFDKIEIERVYKDTNNVYRLQYATSLFATRNKISKYLRQDGMLISYTENGKHVLERFINKDNLEDLSDNFFSLDKNWEKLCGESEIKALQTHPMSGKTFFCIGDSLRWKWCAKLAEMANAKYGGDVFDEGLAKYGKKFVCRYIAEAMMLIDKYKQGTPVDYIFFEYTHSYFEIVNEDPSKWYYCNPDITTSEPFLTSVYYDFSDQTFVGHNEAKQYWGAHFSEIVGKFSPKPNAIIALKIGSKQQKVKFKLLGSATKGGNFTIKFTSSTGEVYKMSMAIQSGMTLNDALSQINEIEFSNSGAKWVNKNAHSKIADGTLTFDYTGLMNEPDAAIKMDFEFGTTGITFDGTWNIETVTSDWLRGFYPHDVKKWTDPAQWHEVESNYDSYKWGKALIELLHKEIPSAKIFIFTMPIDMWDYTTNKTEQGVSMLYPDGTFNVQALYNSPRHKRAVQNWKGWRTLADYYNVGFIDVANKIGISAINNPTYYPSNDVHPNDKGYDRVAEILAKEVY